jgi:diguanylate cyclase (GGDEF)-like protein/PAS domain S-box-containing protein
MSNRATFASRMALYFGLLFSAAMAALFGLWYFGFPALGIGGASGLRLTQAIRVLEMRADQRAAQIVEGLDERRGDVLVVAENELLLQQLTQSSSGSQLQQALDTNFKRLQRAYPQRYKKMQIVVPQTGRIVASSSRDELGLDFKFHSLLERASQPGTVELLEQINNVSGPPEVAVLRQMYAVQPEGQLPQRLVGILIVSLDLEHFASEGVDEGSLLTNSDASTLVFDAQGQELAHFTSLPSAQLPLEIAEQVAARFQGSQLQNYGDGGEAIVAYRQLKLSPTQSWTLVHYTSVDAAVSELKGRAKSLVVAGLLLTLAALGCIAWIARRLTRPLHALTEVAQAVGAGQLGARLECNPYDVHEVAVLAQAFDSMARGIESARRELESEVHMRTAELQSTSELLRYTGELAQVGGWEFDLVARAFHWSAETFRIHDMEPPEPPSFEAGMQLFTPESRPLIQAAVSAAIADGTPYDLELQKHTAKGRLIWVRAQGSAVMRDGKAVKLMGALHDITERKAAEAETRIAATAFESQESIFVADADWKILRTNRAFTEMTGFSADEALGKLPGELLDSGRNEPTIFEEMTESILQRGAWQGEVWDKRKNGEIFPAWLILTAVKEAGGAVTHFVATMTDITERKAAEDQITALAFYDTLTDLPNRRLLMDRLDKALATWGRHNRKGALLFVDLDNFKALNDTLGHDTGDQLLQQVAQRLRTCVREGDTVSRLGGDEFVIMLNDLSEDAVEAATHAEVVGEKVLEVLNSSYRLGSYEHRSTPSIGVTLFGEQQETIEEPLKRADLAMYQAKAAGRNTLRFFDPEMQLVVSRRVTLERDLRAGLALGQFILHYQTQVSGANDVRGVEALVRWMHPQRGLVSPLEFIPLAEETGLILPLGSWVLEAACRQLALWADVSAMAHLTLAVNVSPRQFRQIDFVQEVKAVLARTGAQPGKVKLELTEGLMVSNIEDVIAKMLELKALGVGFSLDDFGTGYSSLSYLKRLPLDQLKIDQGFVRDILVDTNDAAIAKMVIVLADNLGLNVIAEGVETQAQQDFLASQGCFAYQGYHFSRPLPADVLESQLTGLVSPTDTPG